VALKKPSELFGIKKSSEDSSVLESLSDVKEISESLLDTFDRYKSNVYKVEHYDDKIENLNLKINSLTEELSNKLTKNDFENAMLSHLMIFDESFKKLQAQVKGVNKEDLREFKYELSELTQLIENLLEYEIPKYKKQITSNEIRLSDKFDDFRENVEDNINNVQEKVNHRVDKFIHSIDENLDNFNQRIEETSTEVRKTSDTYQKLSKIIKNKIDSIDEEVKSFEKNISSDISNIKAGVLINEQHLKKFGENIQEYDTRLESVDKYLKKHHQELVELKEEVFSEIEQIPVGNLQENLERLEKKIDYIKETYSRIEPEVIVKEVIREGLLNEPPNTKNSDPLTPLDQKFVTLDQLQEHYRLFINRIQQQLSTLGGGGETQLKYLDDIVGIATNASVYDGKFLKYDHSIGKFVFDTAGGAGSQTLDQTLGYGNTSSLGMSVGVVTATKFYGDGSSITGIVATGSGIVIRSNGSTVGTATTIDFSTNLSVTFGSGIATVFVNSVGYANTAGIATYATTAGVSTYSSRAGIATYASTAGIATYATTAGIATYATSSGIATIAGYASTSGISTYSSTAGIATYATTAGISTYSSTAGIATYSTSSGIATIAGYASTSGISTVAQNLTGSPNITVSSVNSSGVITASDFNSTSDIKLKENVQIIDNPIDKIIKIDGVRFDWKYNNKPSMGVIAQNIEKVLPELVSGEDSKTVNYNGIIGLLIECIKEQQKQIDELAEKLNNLPK